MGTSLTDYVPEEAIVAAEDPAADITLEDLGEDKELNAPPAKGEDGQNRDEPEEDKSEEAEKDAQAAASKAKEPEQKQTADQAAKQTDAEKTTEEILKYLGMESPLKIKGKDYTLKDFAKEDILSFVNKGVRFTQLTQDLSKREVQIAERERTVEANALQATQLMSQYRTAQPGKVDTEPPAELKPSEYDTEDVKSVKQAALAMWKTNQDQAQRLNAIEGGIKNQQTEAQTNKFLDDLSAHKADFPLASTEEVIAVHALRPDIPLNDLVRRSHAIYGSVEHVEDVFKHAPEVRKHFEDKAVTAYLARNSKARVIPQKPSTQGARSVSTVQKPIRGFEDAGQAAKKAFARMVENQEGDND